MSGASGRPGCASTCWLPPGCCRCPSSTPLGAVVFDEKAHADYTVSKVYFESLPGFYVTGNLYRPTGAGPFPAILSPHGHWANGRLENTDVASVPGRAIGLARLGFVVFTYDMIGYNDSRQLPHWKSADPTPRPPWGRREALWGLSLAGLQLWNGIRALDFLESRPEVARDRIGATGASGGATQVFLLAAVDDRVAVSAPVNMISLHMQGGCLCENLPHLRLDTNNVELGALAAPRPLLMVAATGDWTRDTMEVEYPEMRRLYELLGAADRVRGERVDAPHNYNRTSREAAYAWMSRWLNGAPPKFAVQEQAFEVDSPADLLVFHGRALPEGARSAEQVAEEWIAAAERQLAAGDAGPFRAALLHALAFEAQEPALPSPRTRRVRSSCRRRATARSSARSPRRDSTSGPCGSRRSTPRPPRKCGTSRPTTAGRPASAWRTSWPPSRPRPGRRWSPTATRRWRACSRPRSCRCPWPSSTWTASTRRAMRRTCSASTSRACAGPAACAPRRSWRAGSSSSHNASERFRLDGVEAHATQARRRRGRPPAQGGLRPVRTSGSVPVAAGRRARGWRGHAAVHLALVGQLRRGSGRPGALAPGRTRASSSSSLRPVSDSITGGTCAITRATSPVTFETPISAVPPVFTMVMRSIRDERLGHGPRDLGQDRGQDLQHGRLAVLPPGLGLLLHRQRLGQALGLARICASARPRAFSASAWAWPWRLRHRGRGQPAAPSRPRPPWTSRVRSASASVSTCSRAGLGQRLHLVALGVGLRA